MSGDARVVALSITPLKGSRLRTVERVELGPGGARGNRRFFVIDERERMVNSKVIGELHRVVADWDESGRRLELSFPDGTSAAGVVELGREVTARFFSGSAPARVVEGPWSQALSRHLGRELTLVELSAGASRHSAVDRGDRGAVSLISRGSLHRLAGEGLLDGIDARRFRMLIEVDGIEPHGEDAWVGRTVQVGEALLRFRGHVGRCLITSRDPESGQVDLPTLDLLGGYRGDGEWTEPLPFGIYGSVERPGVVRVGDGVREP